MMSNQEFRDRMLSAIEDLKRTYERSIAEVKEDIAEVKRVNERSIAEVKEDIAEVKRVNERSIEEIQHDIKGINNGLRNVETDVAWIKGKLEGTQESTRNKDAKSALWIALGSAVAAIISLIKSFW